MKGSEHTRQRQLKGSGKAPVVCVGRDGIAGVAAAVGAPLDLPPLVVTMAEVGERGVVATAVRGVPRGGHPAIPLADQMRPV